MKLSTQRALSAKVLKVGKKRIWFDKTKGNEIREAITRSDIRSLVRRNVIQSRPQLGTSRVRARKILTQKRKGRQQGEGSRKGSPFARLPKKQLWMSLVRSQRTFVKDLKEKKLVDNHTYRDLYRKIKGGYFRNKRHIKLYLSEQKLFQKK